MAIPEFPTIPVPRSEIGSLYECVTSLKQAVEMLTGQDPSGKYAPHVFIQATPPEALHDGDLWLCTSTSYSFNIWNGTQWLKIAVLPTPAATASGETDFMAAFRVRNRISRR